MENSDQKQTNPTASKENESVETVGTHGINSWLLYSIDESPPWHLSLLFGLQHCLLSISGLMGVPLLLAAHLCIHDDDIGNQARAYLISSVFFISGISTLLQTTLGNRLPILQGSSFAYLAATFATLALPHNKCPDPLPQGTFNSTVTLYNDTDGEILDGNQLWMKRVMEVQGAMAVASSFEVLLGLTGTVSFILHYIGPLAVTPTIALIGLDLFAVAPHHAATNWGIALFTSFILILTSQYLKNFAVPIPTFSVKKKCHVKRYQIFKMFPVIIAMVLGWIFCWILTVTDVLSPDPSNPQHVARADFRINVLKNSPWFRVPYPFQWGWPKVTLAGVVGMSAGVLGSTIESIGDYYACAKLAGGPPPPDYAINRGICFEGIGCVISGIFGTTTGTTSYSENIAAIGITRVGSRRVLQAAGFLLVLIGCLGKLGGIFVLVPEPVIGGLFMVLFGMIAAVGLCNLQYVDLNSSRNIFIIGISIFLGLSVPEWTKVHPNAIQTGVIEIDNIFTIILQSPMLIGGVIGMFFDNTLPGTDAERGFTKWRQSYGDGFEDHSSIEEKQRKCYSLPFSTEFRLAKYFPIFPQYEERTKKALDVQDKLLNGQKDLVL